MFGSAPGATESGIPRSVTPAASGSDGGGESRFVFDTLAFSFNADSNAFLSVSYVRGMRCQSEMPQSIKMCVLVICTKKC